MQKKNKKKTAVEWPSRGVVFLLSQASLLTSADCEKKGSCEYVEAVEALVRGGVCGGVVVDEEEALATSRPQEHLSQQLTTGYITRDDDKHDPRHMSFQGKLPPTFGSLKCVRVVACENVQAASSAVSGLDKGGVIIVDAVAIGHEDCGRLARVLSSCWGDDSFLVTALFIPSSPPVEQRQQHHTYASVSTARFHWLLQQQNQEQENNADDDDDDDDGDDGLLPPQSFQTPVRFLPKAIQRRCIAVPSVQCHRAAVRVDSMSTLDWREMLYGGGDGLIHATQLLSEVAFKLGYKDKYGT